MKLVAFTRKKNFNVISRTINRHFAYLGYEKDLKVIVLNIASIKQHLFIYIPT